MDNSIIESLEKLLLSEDFIALTSKTTKLNVFNVLKLESKEIRHSNFLAWLLNPNENHNLGDAFLKELLQITLNKRLFKKPRHNNKTF